MTHHSGLTKQPSSSSGSVTQKKTCKFSHELMFILYHVSNNQKHTSGPKVQALDCFNMVISYAQLCLWPHTLHLPASYTFCLGAAVNHKKAGLEGEELNSMLQKEDERTGFNKAQNKIKEDYFNYGSCKASLVGVAQTGYTNSKVVVILHWGHLRVHRPWSQPGKRQHCSLCQTRCCLVLMHAGSTVPVRPGQSQPPCLQYRVLQSACKDRRKMDGPQCGLLTNYSISKFYIVFFCSHNSCDKKYCWM